MIEQTETGLAYSSGQRRPGRPLGSGSSNYSWRGLSAGQMTRRIEIEITLLELEYKGHCRMASALHVAYNVHRHELAAEVKAEMRDELAARRKLCANLHVKLHYRRNQLKAWKAKL